MLRLGANVDSRSRFAISDQVKTDVLRFLEDNKDKKIDLVNLGIRGITSAELFEILKNCCGV